MKNTLRFLILAAMAAMAAMAADILTGCGGANSPAAATAVPAQAPITGVATPATVSVVTAN